MKMLPQAVENYWSLSFPVTSHSLLSLLPCLGSSHAVKLAQRKKRQQLSNRINNFSQGWKGISWSRDSRNKDAAELGHLDQWSLHVSFLKPTPSPLTLFPFPSLVKELLPMEFLHMIYAFAVGLTYPLIRQGKLKIQRNHLHESHWEPGDLCP